MSTGYLAGLNGSIYKTIDSGNTWNSQTSITSQHLWSIYFVDNNLGYAAGDTGTIIKTTDGGVGWSNLTSGTSNNLYDVFFIDNLKGYAVGASGIILKTTDGGSNWTSETSPTTNDLNDVFFVDTVGYAVGANGTILKATLCDAYNITDPDLTICNGDSIAIYGIYRSAADTYYDSLLTVNGCDSVHSTVLNVNQTYSITDPALTICSSDSIAIYGIYRSVADTYYDSLLTVNGCDSVYSTVLNVNPVYNISDPGVGICSGDSALIYGTYQSVGGTYYDSLLSVDGCDSVHSTVLTVNPVYNISDPGGHLQW